MNSTTSSPSIGDAKLILILCVLFQVLVYVVWLLLCQHLYGWYRPWLFHWIPGVVPFLVFVVWELGVISRPPITTRHVLRFTFYLVILGTVFLMLGECYRLLFLKLAPAAFPNNAYGSTLASGFSGVISIAIVWAIYMVLCRVLPIYMNGDDELKKSLKENIFRVIGVYCLLLTFIGLILFFFVLFFGFISWAGLVSDYSPPWLVITTGTLCLAVAVGASIFLFGRWLTNNEIGSMESSTPATTE